MRNRRSFTIMRIGIPYALSIAIILALLLFYSCGKNQRRGEQPRLVILYATCSLIKDYLSPNNINIPFTPNLAKFGSESLVFTRHIKEMGQSAPSFASIFTGNQADKHLVYTNPELLLDDNYLMLEFYNENGYETFFWNSHPMGGVKFNFGQGVNEENTFRYLLEGNSSEFLKILEKMKTDKNYKAFVFTNFTITHAPYKNEYLKTFLGHYPMESVWIKSKDSEKYYELYLVSRSIDVFPTMIGLSDIQFTGQSKKVEPDGIDLSPSILSLKPALDLPTYSHTCLPRRMEKIKQWGLLYKTRPRENVDVI